MVDMEATSLRFSAAARTLGLVARRQGLTVPGFRSPPRLSEVDRTLRRRADGGATVAVRLKGRPWVAVLADMIDGVIAANALQGAEAATCPHPPVGRGRGRHRPGRAVPSASLGRRGPAPRRAVPRCGRCRARPRSPEPAAAVPEPGALGQTVRSADTGAPA